MNVFTIVNLDQTNKSMYNKIDALFGLGGGFSVDDDGAGDDDDDDGAVVELIDEGGNEGADAVHSVPSNTYGIQAAPAVEQAKVEAAAATTATATTTTTTEQQQAPAMVTLPETPAPTYEVPAAISGFSSMFSRLGGGGSTTATSRCHDGKLEQSQ